MVETAFSTCWDPCSRHTTRLEDTLYRYRKGKDTGPVDQHRLVSLRSNTPCMPKHRWREIPLNRPQNHPAVGQNRLQKSHQTVTNAAASSAVASVGDPVVPEPEPWRLGGARTWVPRMGWYLTWESRIPSSLHRCALLVLGSTTRNGRMSVMRCGDECLLLT